MNKKMYNVGFDIFAIRNEFRGMGRSLCLDDLPVDKNFDTLLQIYLEYEDYMASVLSLPLTFEILTKLKELCVRLLQHDIMCEVVIYDKQPITEMGIVSIEFLGIEFEVDDIEGILAAEYENLKSLLNCNGLCLDEESVQRILKYLNISYKEVELFYMYKVVG